ncbi:stage V sporulation protein B [Tumebacillus sp. ITR2]|uniref:Stage V sporulation protein B n=1 Tax=Tumebacillus amylolyticus TaxID=2801339 RepID=A0ABS1JB20_9BACL|nr:stage V sporulation protein B [Tumebacillus amylolyticus]
MSKQSFLKGAVILVAASLVTRVLGFVYKIFLSRMIGAEGIGLFQTVFPILMFVMTITTAGLPVALSKLIAEALVQEDYRRVRRIMTVSFTAVLSLSIVFTGLMLVLAPWLTTHVLTDPRAYQTLLAMTPIVIIIAISSILRGYFQGMQNMSPNAIASILEQSARIVTVLLFASYLLPYGLQYAAAGAMLGMVAGELIGLSYLVYTYYSKYPLRRFQQQELKKAQEPFRHTLRSLLEIAVPVTLSRIVSSVTYAIEPILVTRCLVATGVTAAMATTLYGQYSGMAISLLLLPTVFTWSLQTTLVPAISEAVAAKEHKLVQRRLYQAFRMTALVGFPTSAILTLFANELSNAVFNDPAVGPILALMAPCGFLLYLQAPLAGILQGMNRAGEAMFNSIVGSIIKLGVIYYLVAKPEFGIYGVAWSVVISASLTTVLHFLSVSRHLGFYLNIPELSKIIATTVIMCAGMMQVQHMLGPVSDAWLVTLCSLCGFAVYFFILNLLRIIPLTSVRRIPRIGPTVAGFLRFIPFVR